MKHFNIKRPVVKVDEAVAIKDYRKFSKIKRESWAQENIDRFFQETESMPGAELSKNGQRIYMPIELSDEVLDTIGGEEAVETEKEVKDYVDEKGFDIISYKRNRAAKRDDSSKREFKITKVLSDNQELLQKYNADPRRDMSSQNNQKLVVFCQHPYDIVGMSCGRNWTSCMNITDPHYQKNAENYVAVDILYGTIVAYLIDVDDKNINHPYARINIKPRMLGNRMIYQPETSIYGNRIVEFLDKVQEVCDDIYGYETGVITNLPYLYDDIYNNVRPRKTFQGVELNEINVNDDNVYDVVLGAIAEFGKEADLNDLDMSGVTDMSFLFSGVDFRGDISKWDTENVISMQEMFVGSTFDGDISDWDVSRVNNMNKMFNDSSFTGMHGDISKWNVSNVEDFGEMFSQSNFCGNLDAWNVNPDANTFGMFDESRIPKYPKWYEADK